jgi:hypothetical protein
MSPFVQTIDTLESKYQELLTSLQSLIAVYLAEPSPLLGSPGHLGVGLARKYGILEMSPAIV